VHSEQLSVISQNRQLSVAEPPASACRLQWYACFPNSIAICNMYIAIRNRLQHKSESDS
jgi:hypothetical protein